MATHELYPYLCVRDADEAIEYYCKVFGAKETFRLVEPSGRIGHAELEFDGTTLLLSSEFPECGVAGPSLDAPANSTVHLHVDNADEVVNRGDRIWRNNRLTTERSFLRRAFRIVSRSFWSSLERWTQHRRCFTR